MFDNFYVYLLIRPWNGIPCYVGKGKDSRCLVHLRRLDHPNRHLKNIINKAVRLGVELKIIKPFENLSEQEAFRIEKLLIDNFKRKIHGGVLANITLGGDGVSGLIHTEETRIKMSKSQSGRKWTKEMRERIVLNIRSRCSDPEYRNRLSLAQKGRKKTPEHIAKLKLASRGWHHTDEAKAKIAARRGWRHTPETCAKISATKKERMAAS